MYEENKEARGMTYTGLETYVQQAAFDQTLTRLYGAEGAEKAHSRCMEVMEEFYKTFDRPAEALFSAPGRTEIGGNHTDHQKGCVLAASVDLDILAAVAPTQSGIIRVLSQGYPMIEVDLRELDPKEEEINTSAALIRGVASRMSAMGCDLRERGLDVYMTSTVPKGSGLSSSAAYEVLMGTMLNELFWEGRCTAVELAQIGQYAENMFFGKPCGLMDQMASSVGGVVSIDFENTAHPAVEQLDVDLHAYGYALCILDSGAGHEDLTNEYSAITNELRAVCRVFDKEVLREVPEEAFLAELPKVRAAAGDRAVNRAFHVYAENRRALAEKEALRQGDFDKILAVMRSREVSVSIILQNMAQLKALFEKQWESIAGNCDEFLYLGGNEQSTHKYVSELLGKETIDTNNYNRSYGRNGSYSTGYQLSGRELLDAAEVRMLDNRCAILFIRGERAVKDLKYDILKHPNVRLTEDGGAEPYLHGKVEWDIADIFIEEYRDTGRDDIKEKDTDVSAPEETGYELLSEADILKEIEKEEKENGQKENRQQQA